MSYPQQPGDHGDQSWSSPPPGSGPPYGDPTANPVSGSQPGQPVSGYPVTAYQPPGDPAGYPASGYPAPGYAPPGYPSPGQPGYGYPAAPPTNGLAIAALVCSIAGVATCVTAPVGAILGHVARRQIRERGEAGDGMALAGIIVGWILTGLLLLLIAFYVVAIVFAINNSGSDFDSSGFLRGALTSLLG